jgi:fluoride exporter
VIWLGIALLGGLGALARWWVDGRVSAHVHHGFPYGILAVNLSGAFALGVVAAGAELDGDARRLVATGFLGAYTTFSTWMLDSDRLWLQKRRRGAVVNVVGSLMLGLVAVWLGRLLG